MQVVLHAGVHYTDNGKLLKALRKNIEFLNIHGVSLPKPRSYKNPIRDMFMNARAIAFDETTRQKLLSGMIDTSVEEPKRLVMSNSNFFCVPRLAIRDNIFYPQAADRLLDFRNLFHSDEIEIFIAIRNPATLLPALKAATPNRRDTEMTDGLVPMALRWSEMIQRIRESVPNAILKVWCNEDTPMIWGQLLHELSGLKETPLKGSYDLLCEILSPEGFDRFATYMENNAGMTEVQKRRVIAAFMDKFALEGEVEEELDFDGWSEEYIETLTDIYDEDVYNISSIPGVTLITP